MIPDLQISLLCDDVKREKNGKFILIGLFDNITVGQLPAKIPRMCVFNRWCAGDGVFKQRTRIIAPDGLSTAFIGHEVEIKFASHEHTVTSSEILCNLLFLQAGVYWVEILLDDQIIIRHPFTIRVKHPLHRN